MVNYHALTNIKSNVSFINISKFFAFIALLFIMIFVVLPIFKLIYFILFTDFIDAGNIFSTIASNYYFILILKNLMQAFLSTICSLVIGLPAAFFLYHFDFPGRKIIILLCTIPFILPVVVVALAFREIFTLFANFNFNESLLIIVLAHAYYNMSIVIRIVGPYWRKIHKDLEDASELLGASLINRLKYIVFPMLTPVVFSSAILVFLFSFTSFGIILIFGNTNFDTIELLIYRFSSGIYNIQLAVWFSLFQIIFCTGLFFLFARFNQSNDLAFLNINRANKKLIHYKKINQMFILAFLAILVFFAVFPILVLIISSFSNLSNDGYTIQNFVRIFENSGNISYISPYQSIISSIILAAITSIVVMCLGFYSASYFDNHDLKIKKIIDVIFLLPLVVPVITLSFGLIITFNQSFFDLRHTFLIILITHIILGLPFAYYLSSLALSSISKEIKEASNILGCSKNNFWHRIYLPLTKNYILAGIIFSYGVSLGEFGSVAMLRGSQFYTMPVAIYQYLSKPGNYFLGNAYALSVILVLVAFVIFFIIDKFKVNIEKNF